MCQETTILYRPVGPSELEWDPDHDPLGGKLERRAIQLGLAGDALRLHAQDWVVGIEDISGFVAEQRSHIATKDFLNLHTPTEGVFRVDNPDVARNLGIETVKPE